MIYQRSTTFWIIFQVVFAAACIAAGWYGGDLALGLACAGVLAAGAVAFYVAQRRGKDVGGLLTGVGDERVRSIYREATFRTGEMLMYILAIWGVAATAQGDGDSTLFTIMVIFAALWVFNIAWATWSARRPIKGVA